MASVRQKALEQLPDGWLVCRAYGHAWTLTLLWGAVVEDPTTTDGERTMHGWRTEERDCSRCKAGVVTIFDGQLQLQEQRWRYPGGYILPAGVADGDHFTREAKRELWARQPGSGA